MSLRCAAGYSTLLCSASCSASSCSVLQQKVQPHDSKPTAAVVCSSAPVAAAACTRTLLISVAALKAAA